MKRPALTAGKRVGEQGWKQGDQVRHHNDRRRGDGGLD